MADSVGIIGVGLLGTALAERLLSGGFAVLGYDLNARRREALAQLGGVAVETPADVVRQTERIVLSLPTSDIVAQVIASMECDLRPAQIVIDTTTGDPGTTEPIGDRLAARDVQYLDATVSGSSEQARRGDIVLMVGGDAGAFANCRDLFDRLARRSFHVGACGSGARVKLVSNLVLGLNRAALAEGLALATRMGLDPAAVLEVLQEGASYSRIMDTKGAKMISGDFTPHARLSQHLKDVRLILAEGRAADIQLPLSEAHRQLLEAAEAAGYGDADNSAILRAYPNR